jgi:hypothetical protein
MKNPSELTDDELLMELMDWTIIFRTKRTLPLEDRKYYKAIVKEVSKRDLWEKKGTKNEKT